MSNVTVAEQPKNAVTHFADFGAEDSHSFDGHLLKFSKGDWLFGRDAEELKEGTQCVAVMPTLVDGWQKWENGKPSGAKLGLVAEGFKPARRFELGDDDTELWETDTISGEKKDPWTQVYYLGLVKADDGTIMTFSTSSFGGRKAVRKLSGDFAKQCSKYAGKYPVVSLGVGSYQHEVKAYGRIKFPTLEIVDWVPAAPYDTMLNKLRGEPDRPLLQLPAPVALEPTPALGAPAKTKFSSKVAKPSKKGPDDPDDPIPF
jgi:hypothetical protein